MLYAGVSGKHIENYGRKKITRFLLHSLPRSIPSIPVVEGGMRQSSEPEP